MLSPEPADAGPGADAQRAADLAQLQREYRHMELNRRAYAEESHTLLRKQSATIERLRKENDALKGDMAMEFRAFQKPMDSGAAKRVGRLQSQADEFTRKAEGEARALAAMDEQAALLRQKILHQRKMMGGVNAARENQQMVQKQVRILENRLDMALTKFNEALAHKEQELLEV